MTIAAVRTFIDACLDGNPPGDEAFNRLALQVFARQYEDIPLYRRLCDLRGKDPTGVEDWADIPAAPADLFKENLFDSDPAVPGGISFLSSGTTAGTERRSRHVVGPASLDLYRRASLGWFREMLLPDAPGPLATLIAGPTSASHPHSSLGHMYGWIAASFGAGDRSIQVFDSDGTLDTDAALRWLDEAASGTQPVLILALTTTVTSLLTALRDRGTPLRLPADSRLVHTGGPKGGRTWSRAGILKAAWRFLHIPAYLCAGEYGMTELLSQFYEDALRSRWSGKLVPRANVGPPWVRTTVVDPVTLLPVAGRERGLLRHLDLANCESVSSVQTLDIGAACGDGFELFGRASGAEARGCSQLMSVVSAGDPS